MRKFLLVIALIGASFAGGAAVNGPGLQFLKAYIAEKLHGPSAIPTLDLSDGPSVEVDTPSFPPPKSAVDPVASQPETKTEVAEKKPKAVIEGDIPPEPESPAVADAPADPPSDPPAKPEAPVAAAEPPPLSDLPPLKPTGPAPAPAPVAAKPAASSGWEDAPGPAPSTAVVPRASVPTAGAMPNPAARPKTKFVSDRAVNTASASPPTSPSPANLEHAPPGIPAPAEPPPLGMTAPTSTPAAATQTAAPPAAPTWPALRSRMKSLGVTKYWVESAPTGGATFRCVAKSAREADGSGDRQFEAEADDELAAAEMALRRVAVWRATERVK